MAILKVANVHHDQSGFTRTQVSTANTYTIHTASSERLRVDSSGNVGIGITSPTSRLHVSGTANITTSLVVGTTDVVSAINGRLSNSTTTLAGTLTITGDTIVGGNVTFDTPASTRIWDSAANTLSIITSSIERVTIGSSGNVGIGITSPTRKLDVVGSAAGTIETLVDGATITPNFGSNNNFTVTISGNRTIANPTNPKAGQSGVVFIQQGIGSNTISWGTSWRFPSGSAPVLSTAANSVDAVVYAVKNTTSIVCSTILNVGG
jgi:hypothetical protein